MALILGEASALLGTLKSTNFNSTADQAIPMLYAKYIVRKITVTNASTNLTLAAGGIYTATSKGGTALVAATQVYTTLSSATKYLDLTLGALLTTDTQALANLYFSLTTAQGATATADIYIIGDPMP